MTEHSKISEVAFQHTLILQAWQCLIGEEQVIYVSGPITTGLRWVEALEAGSPVETNVIAENCAVIRALARTLRQQASALVLEPASLHVEQWSQADYLKLWTTLIERHAAAVVFVDGWPYSIGCALEFERAISRGIATQTANGTSISPTSGFQAIRQAADDLRKRAIRTPTLAPLALRLSEVAARLASQLPDAVHISDKVTTPWSS